MVHFEEILPEVYYFRMSSDVVGVLEGGVRVCYLRKDGKCMLQSLTSNYSEETEKKSELRLLLMGQTRRFNIMDEQFERAGGEEVAFPRRV